MFIDAIMVKVRDGQVTNRPVYVAIGVTVNGERDILGLWAGDGGEGAKFWLGVLTEIRNRGVQDVCMVVCDGLKGLPESITTAWPLATVQASSVHNGGRRDGPAGHRAARGGPMQTRAFEAHMQTCPPGRRRARIVASGSRASSAVMRFQAGLPGGGVCWKGARGARFVAGPVRSGGWAVRRS